MVFLLNYLIAIVSDTYNNIIENEKMAFLTSREDLNCEFMKEESTSENMQKTVELLVFASINDASGDAEWEGMGKSIKKQITKLTKSMTHNSIEMKQTFRKDIKTIKKELDGMQRQFNHDLERQVSSFMSKIEKQIGEIKIQMGGSRRGSFSNNASGVQS